MSFTQKFLEGQTPPTRIHTGPELAAHISDRIVSASHSQVLGRTGGRE